MRTGINSTNCEKATACSVFFRDLILKYLKEESNYEFYGKIILENQSTLEKLFVDIFNSLFINFESVHVENYSQLICLLGYLFRNKYLEMLNKTIDLYTNFCIKSDFISKSLDVNIGIFKDKNLGENAPVSDMLAKLHPNAVALQAAYVKANSNPLGSKHLLDRAPELLGSLPGHGYFLRIWVRKPKTLSPRLASLNS